MIARVTGAASPVSAIREALTFGLALLLGLALSAALYKLLPRGLHVSTTTIGYPIFADFDSQRLYKLYRIAVIGVPLITAAAFVTIDGVVGRRISVYRRIGRPAEPVAPALDSSFAAGIVRSAVLIVLVGVTLGLEFAIWRNLGGADLVTLVSAVVATYGAGMVLTRACLHARWRWLEPIAHIDRLNAMGSVLAVLLLGLVSHATVATVAPGGSRFRVDWFPWFIAIPAAAVLLALLVRGTLGSAPASDRDRDARWWAARTIGAVGMVLLTASLPGQLGAWSSFEDGQQLATVAFVREGLLPYRDFFFVHGLLDDTLKTLVGMSWYGPGYWGSVAGLALLFNPVIFVGWYSLGATVVGRNSWLLLAGSIIIVSPWLGLPPFVRFMFWPYVLLLLGVTVSRPGGRYAVALGICLVVQAVLAPETLYCVPAVGLAVVASDLYRQRSWRLRGFSTTKGVLIGGVGSAL
ncbi:MAG: hypothetical protein M3082_09950, partial [Candidatus Dormibacteraeota bacterium]|nr:hypothetical protein [Candidatus Dormibacteraeota bacterium]